MGIFDTNKTRFISHRGFTPLAPENSLPSFYYAGFFKQWAIETDLHLTKDGFIVCCHNPTIDAYFNGEGAISDLTLKDLLEYKIVKGNKVECFSDEELKIPLFSEYLSICKKFGSVPFIELKTNDAERVLFALKKNGFGEDEIVISSIDKTPLVRTRELSKQTFIHWIFAKEDKINEFAELKNAGISLNIPNSFDCPIEKIKEIQEKGLKICLRACDNFNSLKHMQDLGLDYLPTNCMHDKF